MIGAADVVLAIEMNDLWGSLNAYSDRIVRTSRPMTKSGAKVVTLGTRDLYLKSNYQDFGRFADVDLAIAGDGEASLPLLVERVKTRLRSAKRTTLEARGKSLAQAQAATLEQLKTQATIGWDASPITTARLAAVPLSTVKLAYCRTFRINARRLANIVPPPLFCTCASTTSPRSRFVTG